MILGCKTTIIPSDETIVTTIDEFAFRYNNNITSLHIPKNIALVRSGLLIGSTKTQITVDADSADYKAIDGCLVNIPSKTLVYAPVTSSVPDDPLVSLIVGDSLYGHRTIHLPKYVTQIGGNAIRGTLETITVDDENDSYKVDNNCLITKYTNQLVICSRSSQIPDYVTSIMQSALYDWDRSNCGNNNYAIVIPSTCTYIEKKSFSYLHPRNQSQLKIYLPSTCTKIDKSAFSSVNAIIYTDVASASNHPSGWDGDMIDKSSSSSPTINYGYSLEQFKTIAGI